MALPTVTREYTLTKIDKEEAYRSLAIREAPIPDLENDEVLVRVHAVSLQYRDLAISKGQYMLPVPDGIVPCSDMAGEIVAVGKRINDWKIGDRVCANFSLSHLHGDPVPEDFVSALGGGTTPGVLTQYRAFPAQALVSIPEHLTYEEASTLPCAALTAYNALHGPVPVKAGDFVLVLGTGGVSIFGLQFAVASGAQVIATSSSDEKLKVARELGAKYTINYKSTPDWEQEVLKITNGRGVDHVIEVAGTLSKSIQSIRMGGFVHVIGFVAGSSSSSDSTRNAVFPVIGKSANVRGVLIGPLSLFKDMNRLIEANPKVTKPVVDKVFNFEEAIDAYAYLESQKHVGKVVIKVASN